MQCSIKGKKKARWASCSGLKSIPGKDGGDSSYIKRDTHHWKVSETPQSL